MRNFIKKSCLMMKSSILFVFLMTAQILSVQGQTFATYNFNANGFICSEDSNASLKSNISLSLKNYGTWNTDPSGVTYLAVKIETNNSNVQSMDIHFNNFQLPSETDLYIINDSMDYSQSVITKDLNRSTNDFLFSGIHGSRVTFLCITNPAKVDSIHLDIDTVLVSCLADRFNKSSSAFGEAGSCNQNINCPYSKDAFEDPMRAVFKYTIKEINGDAWECTGTLINQYVADDNVQQYFLTARHCIYDKKDKVKNSFSSVLFNFNYQSPDCNDNSVPLGPDLVPYNSQYTDRGNRDGSRYTFESPVTLIHETSLGIRKGYLGGDMALLKITNPIPPQYNIYYAGWSTFHLAVVSTGSVIGHPQGDIKKFTESTEVINETPFYPCSIAAVLIDKVLSWLFGGNNTTFEQICTWIDDPYYNVQGYTHGGTEEGSSGSPLFSTDKKIIGVLSGGPLGCTSTGITYDIYGKFQRMWVQSSDVQNALNPEGQNVPIGGISRRQVCRQNVAITGVSTTARVFPLPNNPPPFAGYYLKGDLYPASQYQPKNSVTISAQNSITVGDANFPFTELNGADFSFQAGSFINITPGFSVDLGANLNVYIGTCATTARLGLNELIDNNNVSINTNYLNTIKNSPGSKIAMYPNPGSSDITLEYNLENKVSVSINIQDLHGKPILNLLNNEQQEKGPYNFTYSVNELNSGVYLFTFTSGTYTETKRLVIIR